MTGRMWVRTVDGDAVAVDQIVQYTPEEGAATGRTVLTVHTASDWRHYLGPFVSERAALDFALRHLGPVVDPAGLSVEDKQRDASRPDEVSPTADAAIARQRAAQREAGLRLDAPEVA